MTTGSDLPAVLLAVTDAVESLGLTYAVGGAIAQNYWGTVRGTVDVDILAQIPALRYQDLANALNERGFVLRDESGREAPVDVPRIRAMALDRHVFVIYRGGIRVEVFVPFLPFQQEILRRAARLPFEGRTLPITTGEDLVVLKLIFHRPKDLGDVRGILVNQRGRLDLAYLRAAASRVLPDERLAELEGLIAEIAT